MTHASRDHRKLDEAHAEAMGRDRRHHLDEIQGQRDADCDRAADKRYRQALAASGDQFRDIAGHGGALLSSRRRLQDLRTMTDQRQAKVLFAQLIECTSSRGTRYMRGWAGASNLIAFPGEEDEQGRPTWRLYLAERTPKPGAAPVARVERQERVAPAPAGVDADFDSTPW